MRLRTLSCDQNERRWRRQRLSRKGMGASARGRIGGSSIGRHQASERHRRDKGADSRKRDAAKAISAINSRNASLAGGGEQHRGGSGLAGGMALVRKCGSGWRRRLRRQKERRRVIGGRRTKPECSTSNGWRVSARQQAGDGGGEQRQAAAAARCGDESNVAASAELPALGAAHAHRALRCGATLAALAAATSRPAANALTAKAAGRSAVRWLGGGTLRVRTATIW